MGNESGPPSSSPHPRPVAAILVGVGGVIGIAANGGKQTKTRTVTATTAQPAETAPVDPHVAAGAHDFVQFACAQCHGERGRGGVSPDVPALTTVAKSLTPRRSCGRSSTTGSASRANPTKPYMPVWGRRHLATRRSPT